MIWKDRIIQYPHRYTLTNVSGTTYDFAEVTGEVNEVGTPVSAENMNKLLQRDGDDIKDTVTTFSEAGTRANIATGENTSTIFGKIKKWFADLKPHAFNDLATALGAETDKAPTNKLLNDTAALKIDKTDISTTAPISSAAASNEKVYSEKLAFDQIALRELLSNKKTDLTDNSDTFYPTQKAVKTAVDLKAPTNSPTFTGTVTVPAPTNPTDAARLQDVTALAAVYDIVIKTQAEFEALIADPTWFGAKSVAFVGQFTLSTANNSGVKIPATVKQIHGFNSAKITVTNFKYNETTAKGGLWYDAAPTTNDYSIRDLEVSCTGEAICYGFRNCGNLSNCTGTGSGTGSSGIGFYYCNNLSNCTGTGTGTPNGYGFSRCNNLSNCTGTGTGTYGYGFRNCGNLSNCTGTGTGATHGYSFADINYAVNCKHGGSSTTDMWGGTNKNIDIDTCVKNPVTADNTTLNT